MFDVIKGLMQLMIQFINGLFYIEIDLFEGFNIYLGVLVITTISILLILSFVLRAIGVVEKE